MSLPGKQIREAFPGDGSTPQVELASKITYLALLNILLPYQILTGVLIWGADRWPQLFDRIGGLWLLAPAHTLGSYLFLAFLIGHIYLATIGPSPWTHLRSMTVGQQMPVSTEGD